LAFQKAIDFHPLQVGLGCMKYLAEVTEIDEYSGNMQNIILAK
jgi:hypothetical protein